MEEIIDFDEWIKNFQAEKQKYVAVYDPDTGVVTGVGPERAFLEENYKIEIDEETAIMILEGTFLIHNCRIDFETNTLIKNLSDFTYNISDILHRISDKKYSQEKVFDIYITYGLKNKKLKIELSSLFGGTKKQKGSKRSLIWNPDQPMNFLFTSYNDPNILYTSVACSVNDLIGKPYELTLDLPPDFSIFTRRMFRKYVVEYK